MNSAVDAGEASNRVVGVGSCLGDVLGSSSRTCAVLFVTRATSVFVSDRNGRPDSGVCRVSRFLSVNRRGDERPCGRPNRLRARHVPNVSAGVCGVVLCKVRADLRRDAGTAAPAYASQCNALECHGTSDQSGFLIVNGDAIDCRGSGRRAIVACERQSIGLEAWLGSDETGDRARLPRTVLAPVPIFGRLAMRSAPATPNELELRREAGTEGAARRQSGRSMRRWRDQPNS